VLHRADSDERLAYSLAATFLGRMCLSGEIAELSDTQWNLVLEAQRLYRRVAGIVKNGTSRRFGQMNESWRYPKGWQAVVRTATSKDEVLVVLHGFENAPEQVEIPLPAGSAWKIAAEFPWTGAGPSNVSGNQLVCSVPQDFTGRVLLLTKGA
jgi:alpha-galactosidase